MGQLCFLIRQRVSMRPEEALFFFVNNTLPPSSSPLSVVYEVIPSPSCCFLGFSQCPLLMDDYTLFFFSVSIYFRNTMKRISFCTWPIALRVFMALEEKGEGGNRGWGWGCERWHYFCMFIPLLFHFCFTVSYIQDSLKKIIQQDSRFICVSFSMFCSCIALVINIH